MDFFISDKQITFIKTRRAWTGAGGEDRMKVGLKESKGRGVGAGLWASFCTLPLWGSLDTLHHRLGTALVGLRSVGD